MVRWCRGRQAAAWWWRLTLYSEMRAELFFFFMSITACSCSRVKPLGCGEGRGGGGAGGGVRYIQLAVGLGVRSVALQQPHSGLVQTSQPTSLNCPAHLVHVALGVGQGQHDGALLQQQLRAELGHVAGARHQAALALRVGNGVHAGRGRGWGNA